MRCRHFALPLVDRLAGWPESDRWAGWLSRLHALVPRVLRRPTHVLRVLAELAPIGEVGPVTLREVQRRAGRAAAVCSTSSRRTGATAASSSAARTRRAAERSAWSSCPAWPSGCSRRGRTRIRCCSTIAAGSSVPASPLQATRGARERLLLQLAAGAATERLYVSFPSLELGESRPRVPSFYALDVMRAVTGTFRVTKAGAQAAARIGRATRVASAARPAPRPSTISSTTSRCWRGCFRREGRRRDRARALPAEVERVPAARGDRALGRSMKQWSPADGVDAHDRCHQAAARTHRLTARPYSLSALQRYAACPYQFLLSAIYRLAPVEEPEPLQRMDPLTRGSLFHCDSDGVLPDAASAKAGCRSRSAASVSETLSSTVARRGRRVSRRTGASRRARVGRRGARARTRSAALARSHRPDPNGWEPWRFEFAFGFRTIASAIRGA